MADLAHLLAEHRQRPFPPSVVKGVDYGEVDPVMIDADIYGWGLRAADAALSPLDRQRLRAGRDALSRSMSSFPEDAREYYENLLEIATVALDESP